MTVTIHTDVRYTDFFLIWYVHTSARAGAHNSAREPPTPLRPAPPWPWPTAWPPPTRPEPYLLVVFLDDDGSGAQGGPTAGDLRSGLRTFTATGEPVEVDFQLSEQGAPGAPNPGN